MLTGYSVDGDTLHVILHCNLDITTRAAAALEIEALIRSHGPRRVTVEVPGEEPTSATLSAVLRARRMCRNLGIPLEAVRASTPAQRLFSTNIT
ncbi:hypothetical protein DMH25_01420 [Streptomyces sp. WAC 01325]|uniref:hypothetical protein n=1 Tax=Streptomyces sp. WAC 01325 TaxID=2203202 RepID=UPI000F86D526|nr:hypothetical protein [Streptomyces sp. WAC 01325]RSN18398.1 hypothetical protein DMH25_01420 [Streptomyces sp. WAC 01325]